MGKLPAVLGTGGATANRTDPTEAQLASCGVNYCPWTGLADEGDEENENFKVSAIRIYVLSGIFVVCAALGPVVVGFLVDPLSR